MRKHCNSIECVEHNKCSGCGACASKCPFNAISMQYDAEGFLYPVINRKNCTNCGACKQVCPAWDVALSDDNVLAVYAAWAEDEQRMECASGGIFSSIANKIIADCGYVCGAVLNQKLQAEHIITDSICGVERMKGNKYIQSEASHCYQSIEQLLQEGKKVLFGGCPCQAVGLRKYLGKEYKNLYIVDVMCTGCVSQLVWDKYLKEYHRGKAVYQLKFQDKKVYGWIPGMSILFRDGTRYYGPSRIDPFYKVFIENLACRESCAECDYLKSWGQGDITLGDWRNTSQTGETFDDGNGISVVVVHNKKGKQLLELVKDTLKGMREVSPEVLSEHVNWIHRMKQPHPNRNRFLELLQMQSLEKAYQYAKEDRYDVGIVGVWWGSNYGSMMTYYALVKMLQSYGLSVLMTGKPKLNGKGVSYYPRAWKFAQSHYEAIGESYSLEDMWRLNRYCDAFVLGSDQVWNYGIASYWNLHFFLDFAHTDKKKIAYAASFGHDQYEAPRDEVDTYRELLAGFDSISVREKSGVDILKNTFGIRGTHVLDPVFMVAREVYDNIIEESDKHVEAPFIATYILDPTPEKREAILYVAKQKGLRVINMLDGLQDNFKDNQKKLQLEADEDVEVQDWLYYISHCDYLITDSCHGASFAVIYEKPFVCIGNAARGLSRFESLFQVLRMEERLVFDAAEILKREDLLGDIDYQPIRKALQREREKSRKWLENALFSKRTGKSHRFYPYIDSRLEMGEEETVRIRHSIRYAAKCLVNKIYMLYDEYMKRHINQ